MQLLFRHRAEIPYQPKERQRTQHVVTDIKLPPVETLVGGALVVVVIVVPAFAQRDEGHQGAVLALVCGLVTHSANDVAERVDAECSVIGDHGADKETPDQTTQATHQVADDGKEQAGHPVITIQPAQLRVLGEIADRLPIGVNVIL